MFLVLWEEERQGGLSESFKSGVKPPSWSRRLLQPSLVTEPAEVSGSEPGASFKGFQRRRKKRGPERRRRFSGGWRQRRRGERSADLQR